MHIMYVIYGLVVKFIIYIYIYRSKSVVHEQNFIF